MKTIAICLMVAFAFATVPTMTEAASKKCPDGKVYSPKAGKCVTKRGS
jgi:hypothetical protein